MAVTLCWLACASGIRADLVHNHVGGKLQYPSVIQEENAGQAADWQQENWLAYGETASGHKVQRYFDPEAGRFLTQDPLGLADGSNPFNYTHQNPWGHFDAEGLFTGDQYDSMAGNIEHQMGVQQTFVNRAQSAVDDDRQVLAGGDLSDKGRASFKDKLGRDKDELQQDSSNLDILRGNLKQVQKGKANLVEVSQNYNLWATAFAVAAPDAPLLDPQTLNDNGSDRLYNLAAAMPGKVAQNTAAPRAVLNILLLAEGLKNFLPGAGYPEVVAGEGFEVQGASTPKTGVTAFPKFGAAQQQVAQQQQALAGAESAGSTADLAKGTTLARDLREQLAIEQAASNPTAGTKLPINMTDPRWPGAQGWEKWQQIIKPGGDPINTHYLYNPATGQMDDFKIVLPGAR